MPVLRFLTLIFVLLATPYVVHADSCKKLSSKELRDFFNGHERWTEVKSEDSKIMAENEPVFITLNFEEPHRSQIKMGDKIIIDGDNDNMSLCYNTETDQITVDISLGQLIVNRSKSDYIFSNPVFLVLSKLYYRPADQVKRREKTASDDKEHEEEGTPSSS